MAFMLPADEGRASTRRRGTYRPTRPTRPTRAPKRRKKSRTGGSISLRRPVAKRVWMIPAAVIVVAGLVAAGLWFVPKLFGPAQLPDALASDAAGPLQTAISDFEEANGAYPQSFDDLMASGEFEPVEYVQYMIVANSEGTEFVAGLSDFTVGYIAFTSDSELGEGDTMREAMTDAGWSSDWAVEAGFAPPPTVEREYGALIAHGKNITRVVTSLTSGEYTATVTPVPTVGAGASWQESAQDAGADPEVFDMRESGDTVETDAGALTVVEHDGAWLARFEAAPTAKGTSMVLEAALEEAGIEDVSANGSYVCATALGELGIHSVTGCRTNEGISIAWSTTGLDAATQDVLVPAIGYTGADAAWLDEHSITAPTYNDLF